MQWKGCMDMKGTSLNHANKDPLFLRVYDFIYFVDQFMTETISL